MTVKVCLLDVFDAPVLAVVMLFLPGRGADLSVVVNSAIDDVQYLSGGTVRHDVTLQRPLLRCTTIERL